jgi:chromosome partitioning protein
MLKVSRETAKDGEPALSEPTPQDGDETRVETGERGVAVEPAEHLEPVDGREPVESSETVEDGEPVQDTEPVADRDRVEDREPAEAGDGSDRGEVTTAGGSPEPAAPTEAADAVSGRQPSEADEPTESQPVDDDVEDIESFTTEAAPVPTEPHTEASTPVDNAVDKSSSDPVFEHETGPLGAGDNAVDEASSIAVDTRFSAPSAGDRDALAAAIPEAGDDTPLARDLADNARRRIQLTGRPFPKPAVPRVLTVANQKGGVGKTTTTVNVAAAMAQAGLQVLVIDLDPQGNASTALGIDHHAEVPSIYDVLVDGAPLLEVVQPCTTVPGLFCAPATIDLAGAEIELVSLVARESRLQRAIQAASQTGHAYDYILIDCPPSLGLLTVNAMVAASEVFIPIQCEYYALEGLSQLLKNIELVRAHLNPPLHVSTILLTMYDGRTRLSAQVAEEVREHFPVEVLRTTVPRSVRVSEAPSFGETVMTYDPASSGALAYLEAAGEIADRGATGPQ